MFKILLKILGIIVLLAGIATIAYLKSNRSQEREAEYLKSIKAEYFLTQDSLLLKEMSDSLRLYIDSIQRIDTFYRLQIDSLNEFYFERESLLIAKTKEEAEAEKKKTISVSKKKKTIPKIDPIIEKIRTEYRKNLKELPGDLTQYEKKVAYNEIMVELSQQYKISPDSVKRIIK